MAHRIGAIALLARPRPSTRGHRSFGPRNPSPQRGRGDRIALTIFQAARTEVCMVLHDLDSGVEIALLDPYKRQRNGKLWTGWIKRLIGSPPPRRAPGYAGAISPPRHSPARVCRASRLVMRMCGPGPISIM